MFLWFIFHGYIYRLSIKTHTLSAYYSVSIFFEILKILDIHSDLVYPCIYPVFGMVFGLVYCVVYDMAYGIWYSL